MTNPVLAISTAGLATLALVGGASTAAAATTPPEADLVVNYGFTSVDGFGPGTEYAFAFSLTNTGPSDAAGATLVLVVPPMLTVPNPPEGCTVDGPGLICEIDGVLPAGATVDFTGQARLDDTYTGDGTDIVRTAIAWSDLPDPDDTNNVVSTVGPRIEG